MKKVTCGLDAAKAHSAMEKHIKFIKNVKCTLYILETFFVNFL